MMTLMVDDSYITIIEKLRIENAILEGKISECTPIMNGFFRDVIKRNLELIDRYYNFAIEIIKE